MILLVVSLEGEVQKLMKLGKISAVCMMCVEGTMKLPLVYLVFTIWYIYVYKHDLPNN